MSDDPRANSPDPADAALAAGWLRAVADPDVASALEGVYAGVADAVARRGPVCWASGRCCNFERTGHRLYVTGLEAAFCAARAGRGLSVGDVAEAAARGGCPYQEANLCGAHGVKPLGCRVYFCDRTAQEWQHALAERSLEDVRRIHDAHGVPYRYGEWRAMLALLASASG